MHAHMRSVTQEPLSTQIHKETCMQMFVTGLFGTKELKAVWVSTRGMGALKYQTHKMEPYAAFQINELDLHKETWKV